MLIENEFRMQDIKNIHESENNILNACQSPHIIKLEEAPQCRRGQSNRGRRANRHSPADINLVTSTTSLPSNSNNQIMNKTVQNIQCHTCQKTFNNSSALAKHKLIHSDERKYTCAQCSKSFKRQDHLNGHMMTHSSKKPYECRFLNCDKSYCDNRSLRRHYDNHHNPADLQNSIPDTLTPGLTPRSANSESQSQIFNFDSLDSQMLSTHSQLSPASPSNLCASPSWTKVFNPYDEPKPIKCNLCEKRFKNMPALNGHMRLHGGYNKKDIIQIDNLDIKLYTDNKIKEEEFMISNDSNKDIKSDIYSNMFSNSNTEPFNNSQLDLEALQKEEVDKYLNQNVNIKQETNANDMEYETSSTVSGDSMDRTSIMVDQLQISSPHWSTKNITPEKPVIVPPYASEMKSSIADISELIAPLCPENGLLNMIKSLTKQKAPETTSILQASSPTTISTANYNNYSNNSTIPPPVQSTSQISREYFEFPPSYQLSPGPKTPKYTESPRGHYLSRNVKSVSGARTSHFSFSPLPIEASTVLDKQNLPMRPLSFLPYDVHDRRRGKIDEEEFKRQQQQQEMTRQAEDIINGKIEILKQDEQRKNKLGFVNGNNSMFATYPGLCNKRFMSTDMKRFYVNDQTNLLRTMAIYPPSPIQNVTNFNITNQEVISNLDMNRNFDSNFGDNATLGDISSLLEPRNDEVKHSFNFSIGVDGGVETKGLDYDGLTEFLESVGTTQEPIATDKEAFDELLNDVDHVIRMDGYDIDNNQGDGAATCQVPSTEDQCLRKLRKKLRPLPLQIPSDLSNYNILQCSNDSLRLNSVVRSPPSYNSRCMAGYKSLRPPNSAPSFKSHNTIYNFDKSVILENYPTHISFQNQQNQLMNRFVIPQTDSHFISQTSSITSKNSR